MPKRTNDFQTLVRSIYEQIVPAGGKVEESGQVYDKQAQILREVDILVTYRYAGHDFRMLVECRDRSRTDSVQWIDELIGKASSLDVNKIVAVSSKGFSDSAVKKARANGIDTLTLESATDADWINFPIKPGLVVTTDDSYSIEDVLYESGDGFVSMSKLGWESQVEIDGEIEGRLFELASLYFQKIVAPQIDEYKKANMFQIFKTKEDLEKTMRAEAIHDWPKLIVLTPSGERVEVTKVKYIVTSTRQAKIIEPEHRVFNQTMVSTGEHLDLDGTLTKFLIVQDSETRQAHVKWERSGEKN